MPTLGRFRRELRWRRFWSVPVEREVDSELAFHLEMRARELVEQGMSPDDARAAAVARFGDVDLITQACRDLGRRRNDEMRRAQWLAELRDDLRYAVRGLRASPGFTAVALLTLAMGIGASTTIFSVANAVLLRPFPYHEPERIVRLYETNPTTETFGISEPNYLDWLERVRSLSQLAAFTAENVSLLGEGDPEELGAMVATPSLFPLLGVRPLLGRVFGEAEAKPDAAARVVVLSNAVWQTRFGADPQIIGRTVNLSGTSYEVIGVMPPAFAFPGNPALWMPLAPSMTPRGETARGNRRLGVIGRLAPDVTLARALDEMRSVARDLARQYPETNAEWGANVTSLEEWLIGDELRMRVQVLLVAVGLLLLMGCVNVANLLLARATARQREMSVRAALGAGRGRIVRQLLTESLVLAAIGAAFGIALTAMAVPVLRDVGETAIPRLDELSIDWRVVAFGIVASVFTGILFGIAPALQASRADLNDVLRAGGRVAAAGRLRSILIVASVALALVLLVGAGLVGRSFDRLMRVDYGFRTEGVFTASLTVSSERYRERARRAAFYAEAARRLATAPGIRAVGFTNVAPFSGGSTAIRFSVVGRQPASADEFLSANWRSVTPGYFAAIGVPLKQGRLIADSDGEREPRVVVVTETMARRIWPGADPVGQQITLGGNAGPTWTVIGVVGDIRDQLLQQDPEPMMYLSFQQVSWDTMWLLVRGTGDPLALAPVVRREVHAIDPLLPVANEQPLARLVSEIAAQPRFTALVFGLFASAALVLAVVGVYGIVAYGVTQRTRELGVRMALGATPSRIVRGVVRHGLGLAGFGIAMGIWAAYALSRFMQGILYAVAPTDLVTYLVVAALLLVCAAAASILPARGAARLDPVRALRDE
ncbi:MAG TPA: ABC transporter permease [Gemmatimonadaceae bacterium]|nr:ABC transporter permease [Gemmatimonadaceae bacterium]